MRNRGLILTLPLAFFAIGCAVDSGYWPAGTQATVTPPKFQRILARVRDDQKTLTGGRNLVSIESGTRVVCLDPLVSNSANPQQLNPYAQAVSRVRILEGASAGLEVLIPRQALTVPPEPPSTHLGVALSIFGFVLLAFCVARLIAAAMGRWSRRREVIRQWIEAHPGESPPKRARGQRPGLAVPSARFEDQTEWAGWLAERNARSRKSTHSHEISWE